jgi:hypothetical protein
MLNGFQNPRMIKLIVISGTVNYDDWGVSDEISLHLDSRCFIPWMLLSPTDPPRLISIEFQLFVYTLIFLEV